MINWLRYYLLKLAGRFGLTLSRDMALEKYIQRLEAGGAGPSIQEVARIHLTRLYLENDPEKRLRSIETLASLDREMAIPLVVRELARYSKEDVRYTPPKCYMSLLDVLGEFILRDLRDEVQSFLTFASLGIDPNAEALPRYLPIRVYLSTEDPALVELVSHSILAYLDMLGFYIVSDVLPVQGSWFKKWFAKSKEVLSRNQVVERLEKGEGALELAVIHKEQALVDRNQAEAAARLIESLANVPNASCQIGSILVAKVTDEDGVRVYTRSLTASQMIFLEKNQDLLTEPQTVLLRLEEAVHGLFLEGPNAVDKGGDGT